jgi:hypothetical protein
MQPMGQYTNSFWKTQNERFDQIKMLQPAAVMQAACIKSH